MRAVTHRFLPRNSPTVTPMVMMPERDVKADRRAVMVVARGRADGRDVNGRRADWRRTVDHRGRVINDRRGLINHRLLHHDGLGVNHGGLRRRVRDDLLDGLLDDHRCGLINNRSWLINDRRRIYVNRRWIVNRDGFRLEGLGDEQARSHACHDFTSGGPFPITGLEMRGGSSDHGQCCDCH
jgi:hypothetical protein